MALEDLMVMNATAQLTKELEKQKHKAGRLRKQLGRSVRTMKEVHRLLVDALLNGHFRKDAVAKSLTALDAELKALKEEKELL